MNNDKNSSFWFFKIGVILIAAWYLLLLYRFPFYLPYAIQSGDEAMLAIYMSIILAIFVIFITSFALFVVRTIHSISYGQPKGNEQQELGLDFFSAAKNNFLYQIRLLVILSFIVLWLSLANGVEDEEALFSLVFFAVLIILVMNAVLKRLLSKAGDLTAPRWSPTPWIATITFVSGLSYLFLNSEEAIEYLKQFLVMLWALFSGDESRISGEIILLVVLYLVALIASGVTAYRRYRDVANDIRKLINLLKEKFLKSTRYED